MNASNPMEIREKATEAQLKKLSEVRDCPAPECSGHLDRTDMWMHDGVIMEEYLHKGGSHDCECVDSNSRFWQTDKILAQHYRGRSEGTGCLKGEFR